MRGTKLALLLAMSMMAAVVSAPPAAALAGSCSESGNYEVCFTYGAGIEDRLIASEIKAKIDATADAKAAGATGEHYIRVAIYNWGTDGGGTAIADSLVRASQLGVSVRIVVGPSDSAITTKFKNAGIDLVYCPDACQTPGKGSMHNKFFVIKKGDTKLVLQSSSNLSEWQARHAQNLLISRDDDLLFSAYVNYWRRLAAGTWTYDGIAWDTDAKRMIDGSNDLSKAYFFPQPSSNRVADVLGNVSACTEGNDRVWLESSLVEDEAYAREIIAELNRLAGIGCDVKVIVQEQSGSDILQKYGVASTDISCDGWSHNKLLLIDAKYAGEWRKAVFVGSYNLTDNSAHGANDVMLRVIDGWVTNRYIDQFRVLWTNPHACDQAT
ncbi:phospholipase D-like domain-containing protein [Streptomyces sp. P17]|uniref:phospholipase D-like domain-containing protein n=1 Tax=Streptomyces sp. P17 TaxID=3074716 RepID=UPI0028F44C76|nr:phospholipase D-like domain-containing protein [Streptomyces sp. P17]MDT9700031.1 phospholipase D-like domain-containing protein [Streptomyces sp. P17]